jgi:hypothetical protein
MTDRITQHDLEAVCRRINRTVNGTDETPLWSRIDDQNVQAADVYYISGAYGGHALYRVGSDGRGAEDVFRRGHVPKRELYDLMQAFLTGVETARDTERVHV